ncbi:MAG: hypothetical protein ACD_30C00092G0019 [uncultured bacterium]|uniref:Ribonuclease VapC n=3 Tax=Candidatus Daviesiibacteriota TaxID=1752718 RepID=A0A0G0F933_9BACT|nr:MAG: hypothetical protein ACD_30C00092G0019 [uncultured bacterium]KKQ10035.1 MAG: hypothetical protein US19_C0009G0037 [Candidatus Daviesbacteria bacterium GW2011_GWB1_36_5]KKQ15922.1 MAG: hypothetical protein US28_C0007G0013 [Candidatus Daviesbacteria bacterium GW2011_GWA1_36_8]OGE30788.1 MAG: hypothetical protein A3C99_00595 [Candidatus Daviesbacteria bacterium RIFCSPHIGHO2_02_FULL_37_9]OGE35180.1 MAG: hypothetical protein A3E66_01985 [Candidatus Daviesbacteria bacterium RIFCSPHIGHO2_12_FU
MIVVDTSVAFKWFDPTEDFSLEAEKILKDHLAGKNIIIVPDLFFYELANSWATKSELTLNKITRNFKDLEKIKLLVEIIDLKSVSKAAKMSKKCRVSVYDAIYAVLAKEKGCNLITADSRFVKQVGLAFVKDLGEFGERKN